MEYSDKTGGWPLELEREAVAKGAALLDKILPGWHNHVALEKLTMTSGQLCMMGQLFGTNVEGRLVEEMYPGEKQKVCNEGGGIFGYDIALMPGRGNGLVIKLRKKLGIEKETEDEYFALRHVCYGHDNKCLWAEAVAERKAKDAGVMEGANAE